MSGLTQPENAAIGAWPGRDARDGCDSVIQLPGGTLQACQRWAGHDDCHEADITASLEDGSSVSVDLEW